MFGEMDIDTMIGCHGPVVHGASKIKEILDMYHDGIKYVHDQTVRGMEHLLTLGIELYFNAKHNNHQ